MRIPVETIAFSGHDLGPFEPVETVTGGYQAECRKCDKSVWVGDNGVMYSLLGEWSRDFGPSRGPGTWERKRPLRRWLKIKGQQGVDRRTRAGQPMQRDQNGRLLKRTRSRLFQSCQIAKRTLRLLPSLDFCPHTGVYLGGIANRSQVLQPGKGFFIGIDGLVSALTRPPYWVRRRTKPNWC